MKVNLGLAREWRGTLVRRLTTPPVAIPHTRLKLKDTKY